MRFTSLAAILAFSATTSAAQTCGGPVAAFKDGLVAEAVASHNINEATARAYVANLRLDDSLDFVPDPSIVVSGSRELELMEAQRLSSGKFLV